jgi:hypothetical protein
MLVFICVMYFKHVKRLVTCDAKGKFGNLYFDKNCPRLSISLIGLICFFSHTEVLVTASVADNAVSQQRHSKGAGLPSRYSDYMTCGMTSGRHCLGERFSLSSKTFTYSLGSTHPSRQWVPGIN